MAKKPEETSVIDPKQAQAAIDKDRQDRAKRCWEEMQAVLQKHQCSLDVAGIDFVNGACVGRLQLVAK